MTDEVRQDNINAGTFVNQARHFNKNTRVFGRPTWLPLPEDRKAAITSAVGRINTMCRPTVLELQNPKNKAELQDRLYREIKQYESRFNACMYSATNLTEVVSCADGFVRNLDTEVTRAARNILRDY
jgi:hypothetical protein